MALSTMLTFAICASVHGWATMPGVHCWGGGVPRTRHPRHAPLLATEEGTAPKVPRDEEHPFSLASARRRMADGYQQGVARSQAYFNSRRPTDAIVQNAVPLRNSDRVAGMILAVLYVESALFSASLILAWLVGASEAFAVVGQGRLFAALAVATNVRSCTRLPRLCVEVFALPWVFRQVRSRAIDLRASFVKDRAAQTLAVTAVVFLTLRAANKALLLGTTAPAAVILWEKFGILLGALLSPLVDLVPAVGAVSDVLGGSVSWFAVEAWAIASRMGGALVALEQAARHAPVLTQLFLLADLERHLVVPAQFVVAALEAFKEEVILPTLKTLGWLTMQTLG